MTNPVKTRFAPSPTGCLHVGGARTALFSFLYARHNGGKFLLRIEDTDRERHVEGAAEKIVEDLRWLGIDWDEGYGVGGPHGPYVQSERLEIYRQYVQRLLEAGSAYYAFESSAELEAQRKSGEAAGKVFRYTRPAGAPSDPAAAQAARAAGKEVVVRFKTPGQTLTIHDEVFGDVSIPGEQQEDFVILKNDGFPTYHLANVIDDGLMGVTHVLRGQEFLGQTWRQALLRAALGFPEVVYAHLPLILDMAGRKLSKRDGDVEVHSFRAAGDLPEALANFIALLGWNPGGERERMGLSEMVELFSLDRLGKANARFDRAKLLAFNTESVASAGVERLLVGFKDYLAVNADAGAIIPVGDDSLLRRLIQANKGFRTFQDIVAKTGVLFGPDDGFAYDDQAVAKVLARNDEGYNVLAQLRPRLAECPWDETGVRGVIDGFCQTSGLGMGKVAQPLRVAVTGSTISPAIYDTLLILGRQKTLARIDRCLARKGK